MGKPIVFLGILLFLIISYFIKNGIPDMGSNEGVGVSESIEKNTESLKEKSITSKNAKTKELEEDKEDKRNKVKKEGSYEENNQRVVNTDATNTNDVNTNTNTNTNKDVTTLNQSESVEDNNKKEKEGINKINEADVIVLKKPERILENTNNLEDFNNPDFSDIKVIIDDEVAVTAIEGIIAEYKDGLLKEIKDTFRENRIKTYKEFEKNHYKEFIDEYKRVEKIESIKCEDKEKNKKLCNSLRDEKENIKNKYNEIVYNLNVYINKLNEDEIKALNNAYQQLEKNVNSIYER